MNINKKAITIAISALISSNYTFLAQASIINAPINGGNTTLNNGDKILYNQTQNLTAVTAVNLSSSFDSLRINGAAQININNGGESTAISAVNGSALDLGSRTIINSTGVTGSVFGLNIQDQNTNVIAENLTINSTANSGYAYGLSLKQANVHLAGDTTITVTNAQNTNDNAGYATGIRLTNNSALTIDSLNLSTQNKSGYGLDVQSGSTLSIGANSTIVNNGLSAAIHATGAGTTVNMDKTTITAIGGEGIKVQYGATVNLGSKTIINNGSTGNNSDGIEAISDAHVTADNLIINNLGSGADAGIGAYQRSIIKIGEKSAINATKIGIVATEGSTIDFVGTADARNTITTHSNYGVSSQSSSVINIKNTDIFVDDTNSKTGEFIYGLWGVNGVINAENNFISIADRDNSSAVYARAGGFVNLSGETTILAGSNSKSALRTAGTNSKIYLTGQATINGNIFASGAGSSIDIDATSGSTITGYTTIDTEVPGATIDFKVTDGKWNMSGNSQVNHLTLNDSIVNFTKTGFETLTTNTLEGADGLFNMRTDIVGQRGDLLVINGLAQGDYKLNIINNGSSSTNGSETLTVVKIGDNQANFALTNKVELGAYEYNLRNVEGSPNDLELYSSDKKKSSSADAAGSFLTIGYLSNYVENQTLLQRLGDLRNGQILNTKNDGFWIKGFGGKLNAFSGSGFSGFDADYMGTMLGADREISVENGHLLIGAMAGFTRISPDYRQGSGNGKNYSAALYATYLLDQGLYIDTILKYNSLKNHFSVKDTAGQSVRGTGKTQGISLSAELGKRIWFSKNHQGRYAEPQIQLTYAYQNGDTVNSSNGLKVGLSHYNSFIARVGGLLGYQTSGENPVNVYAKLGIIREMSGNMNYRFNNGEKHNYGFHSGWFNGGIGANVNFNKQHSFYTEADYSTGHSFHNLMFNAGYRFSF